MLFLAVRPYITPFMYIVYSTNGSIKSGYPTEGRANETDEDPVG